MQKLKNLKPENKKALIYWIIAAVIGTGVIGNNIAGSEEPLQELMKVLQYLIMFS